MIYYNLACATCKTNFGVVVMLTKGLEIGGHIAGTLLMPL